jgi:ubiquitin-protein ligase
MPTASTSASTSASTDNNAPVISRECFRRILSDVKDIMKNPLTESNIFYKHDESNMLRGYVLIIPNNDSPYKDGNYFFTVTFPTNYPHSPPTMNFVTNNGKTRFHPNLYRNGKVCLSLLNTWRGDQWSSCNTLSSVLVQLATLFTPTPLTHEPGVSAGNPANKPYEEIIFYQNIHTAICDVLVTNPVAPKTAVRVSNKFRKLDVLFKEEIRQHFFQNIHHITERLNAKIAADPANKKPFKINMNIYNMTETINYPVLRQMVETVYNELIEIEPKIEVE